MEWAGRLRTAVLALDGVTESASKFGRISWAYHVVGSEFLHFHAPTLVDVRLTRPRIKALTPEERSHCVPRKAKSSDWIEVRIGDEAGCAFGVEAARQAWEAARATKRMVGRASSPRGGKTRRRTSGTRKPHPL